MKNENDGTATKKKNEDFLRELDKDRTEKGCEYAVLVSLLEPEKIAAWAAEAEVGYDVAALKKRGRGRPGRGAEPSQVVALRLTLDELAELDARAEREGKTRSEVIRDALTHPAA